MSVRRLQKKVGEESQRVLSTWLTLIFLVLPVISRVVCQSFRCASYDGGDDVEHHFLSVDSSIDCSSDRYNSMFAFALIMMIV